MRFSNKSNRTVPFLFPKISRQRVPAISAEQMAEVDRLMVEEYHIYLIQMMENAGRNLARLALVRFLENQPDKQKIAVLCGSGGNGGGALVSARHLSNYGAEITVCLSKGYDRFSGIALHQLHILKAMGLEICEGECLADREFDLIIDGLIGYSLRGAPQGLIARMIEEANRHPAEVLALDIPSGLQANNGHPMKPTIHARATMTLALPKKGLYAESARSAVGELFLADISVPPGLYQRNFHRQVPDIFKQGEIVQLSM